MEIYIAAGGLAVVILSSTMGVVWKFSRVEIALRADYTASIALLRADHTREIATLRAEYMRDFKIVSDKIYQVEIWARDEFVRKGSFELVVARLEKGMEQLGTKVEGAVEKMATRLENFTHHPA